MAPEALGNSGVIDRPEVLVHAVAGLTSVQKKLPGFAHAPAAIVVDDVYNRQVVPYSGVHFLHGHPETTVATKVQYHAIWMCEFQRIGERLTTTKVTSSGKEEPLPGLICTNIGKRPKQG